MPCFCIRARNKFRISRIPIGSSPFMGSSKIRIFGLWIKDRAMPNLCRIPSENLLTGLEPVPLSPFSGLVYCVDHGAKLHFASCKNYDGRQDHYRCANYKSAMGYQCVVIRTAAQPKLRRHTYFLVRITPIRFKVIRSERIITCSAVCVFVVHQIFIHIQAPSQKEKIPQSLINTGFRD